MRGYRIQSNSMAPPGTLAAHMATTLWFDAVSVTLSRFLLRRAQMLPESHLRTTIPGWTAPVTLRSVGNPASAPLLFAFDLICIRPYMEVRQK